MMKITMQFNQGNPIFSHLKKDYEYMRQQKK